VQEKAKIERSASERQRAAPGQTQSQRRPAPTIDLFGDDTPAPPARPSTTDNTTARPQPRNAVAPPPRQAKQGDSLLGLDFFGNTPASGPARPSSANANPLSSTGQSRPDLKQSILSLYASTPKPQSQSPPHNRQPSFGGMTSPQATQSQNAFGGLADAFGGLSFPSSNPTTSPPAQPRSSTSGSNAFAPSMPTKSTPSAPQVTSPPPLNGGGFFDSLPSKKTEQQKPQPLAQRKPSNGLDFTFAQPPSITSKPNIPASQDLFTTDGFGGFSPPAPPPVPQPPKISAPSLRANITSPFNLSAPSQPPKPPAPSKPPLVSQSSAAMFDPWASGGDNNAWSTPDPPPQPSKPKAPTVDIGKPPAHITPNDISSGWGEPISSSQKPGQAPAITADEDYGGWTSASPTKPSNTAPSKTSSGFGGASDPFDNPWG
jgi:stromal membrane-associated protein